MLGLLSMLLLLLLSVLLSVLLLLDVLLLLVMLLVLMRLGLGLGRLRRRLGDAHRRLHRSGLVVLRGRALMRRRSILELWVLIPTRHVLLVWVLRTEMKCQSSFIAT